jgi:hypothetical protein
VTRGTVAVSLLVAILVLGFAVPYLLMNIGGGSGGLQRVVTTLP